MALHRTAPAVLSEATLTAPVLGLLGFSLSDCHAIEWLQLRVRGLQL